MEFLENKQKKIAEYRAKILADINEEIEKERLIYSDIILLYRESDLEAEKKPQKLVIVDYNIEGKKVKFNDDLEIKEFNNNIKRRRRPPVMRRKEWTPEYKEKTYKKKSCLKDSKNEKVFSIRYMPISVFKDSFKRPSGNP